MSASLKDSSNRARYFDFPPGLPLLPGPNRCALPGWKRVAVLPELPILNFHPQEHLSDKVVFTRTSLPHSTAPDFTTPPLHNVPSFDSPETNVRCKLQIDFGSDWLLRSVKAQFGWWGRERAHGGVLTLRYARKCLFRFGWSRPVASHVTLGALVTQDFLVVTTSMSVHPLVYQQPLPCFCVLSPARLVGLTDRVRGPPARFSTGRGSR